MPATARWRCFTKVGDRVRFLISDVFLPGPETLFASPEGETELEGTVVDFSDSGSRTRAFVVVDVIRKQAVVVPLEKLRVISSSEQQGES